MANGLTATTNGRRRGDDVLHRLYRAHARFLLRPALMIAIVVLCVTIGIMGPFTGTQFTIAERGAHAFLWVAVIWACHFVMTPGLQLACARRRLPLVLGSVLTTLVALTLASILYALFGPAMDLSILAMMTVATYAQGALATLVLAAFWVDDAVEILAREGIEARGFQRPPPPREAINADLPPEKRGIVLAMRVEGKYVEVTTTAGRHLLRGSLADMMSRVDGDAGLRIHRSTWVRRDRIRSLHYRDGNPHVRLDDATELAVSRAVVDDIRRMLTR